MQFSVVGAFPGTPSESLLTVCRYAARRVEARLGPLDDTRPIYLQHTSTGTPKIYADDANVIEIELFCADKEWPPLVQELSFFLSALTLGLYGRSGSNRWFVAAAAAACSLQVLRDIANADRAHRYAHLFSLFADLYIEAGTPIADLGQWVAQREAQFEKLDGNYDSMLKPVVNAISDTLAKTRNWHGLKSMPDVNLPASAFLPLWQYATNAGR